jgi:hypothetical protein
MARSEPVHTYVCIGIAILGFVGVVLTGINLLTDPEINRGDVGGLIGALCAFYLATSSLWTRYAQRFVADPRRTGNDH